jgi:hypothetical protein
LDFGIFGFQDLWITVFQDLWITVFQDVWISEFFKGFRTSGFQDFLDGKVFSDVWIFAGFSRMLVWTFDTGFGHLVSRIGHRCFLVQRCKRAGGNGNFFD